MAAEASQWPAPFCDPFISIQQWLNVFRSASLDGHGQQPVSACGGKIVSPIPAPLYVGIAAVRSQPAAGWRTPCGELLTKQLPTTAPASQSA